jgi:hypothetical protein
VSARVVDTPVALSNVAATVLGLAHVSGSLGTGRDLAPLWTGGAWAPAPVFLEATQPHAVPRMKQWNNLVFERGVVSGGWMMLTAPWLNEPPTMSRVFADVSPDVSPDVSGDVSPDVSGDVSDPDIALADLTALVEGWDAAAPPWRDSRMSDDTREGLKALGYLEE